jgi:hypothetical protein
MPPLSSVTSVDRAPKSTTERLRRLSASCCAWCPGKPVLDSAAARQCAAREAAPRNGLQAAAEDGVADCLAAAVDFQKTARRY